MRCRAPATWSGSGHSSGVASCSVWTNGAGDFGGGSWAGLHTTSPPAPTEVARASRRSCSRVRSAPAPSGGSGTGATPRGRDVAVDGEGTDLEARVQREAARISRRYVPIPRIPRRPGELHASTDDGGARARAPVGR